MSRSSDKRKEFKLIGIPAFDARRGHRRCRLPGVGVSVAGSRTSAIADFWKNPQGRLVIRFSSQGYREHCQGLLASGGPIPDARLDEFGEYVIAVLAEWLVEGVDDTPDAFNE